MNTLKTAVVVVVLLGMAYGGWMLLNGRWKLVTSKGDPEMPAPGAPDAPLWLTENGEIPGVDFDTTSVGATGQPEFGAQGPGGTSPANPGRGIAPSHDGNPKPLGPQDDPFPGRGKFPPAGPLPLDETSPESLVNANPKGGPGRIGLAIYDDVETGPASSPGPVDPAAEEFGGSQLATARGASSIPPTRPFTAVWRSALQQIEDEQFHDALYALSDWLGSPDLTPDESRSLQELLDQLAGTVIYSTEHLMKPAYAVRRGDRLQDIAAQYHVPWQLLANINGIDDPDMLLPGQRIKVVEGPFTARIDLDSRQIVLFLRGYYAGRLPFTPGRDQVPRPGTYHVVSKMVDRIWYDETGHAVPAGHPDNPYGKYWIDLGAGHCIHGSAMSGEDRGCVAVSPGDAQNLYCILAAGSQVIIQ